MSEMLTCPTCDGTGKTGPVHINRGEQPHEWRESMPCLTCAGNKTIHNDKAIAMEFGRAARNKRVARGESLREASKRYGMSPAELSGLERGDGGMAAWEHPFATLAWLDQKESNA